MELLQMRYFCDSAASQSFSATAKKYGVPPSDISQSIKRLEGELGVSLFTRRANRVELNPKGRELLSRLTEALNIIDSAVEEFSGIHTRERLTICINTNRRIVMSAIEKYRLEHPNVDIVASHFTDTNASDTDFIISNDASEPSGFEKRLLLEEKIMLAVSSNDDTEPRELNIETLSDAPFISMTERSSLYSITNRICQHHGFTPHIAVMSDDPFYVRKCVELGLGVAFVPSISWRGQFSPSVRVSPLSIFTADFNVASVFN